MVHLGQSWSPLIDIRVSSPLSSTKIYSDAAGGSPSLLNGLGGLVCLENSDSPVYFYHAWPSFIQLNTPTMSGVCFKNKLTFLEASAALAGVLAAPISIAGGHVTLVTDNIGCYWAGVKGHSRCPFTYTIVKALKIEFQPRRSSIPAMVADECSKARLPQARDLIHNLGYDGVLRYANLSRTFLAYLENPVVSRVLGSAILEELSCYTRTASVSPEWTEEVAPLVFHSSIPDLVMY